MPGIVVQFPQPAYPWSETGYANVDDVARYINSAAWDPDQPNSFPTVAQAKSWLQEATGLIDVALASRGYLIPLTVRSDYTLPTGMKAINSLHPGIYLVLRNAAAHYGAGMLEAARHGSISQQEVPNAKFHMALFDDFLSRIESGADNLSAFGAEGTFLPEIDPASGVQSGNIGAFTSTSAMPDPTQGGPRFSNASMKF